MDTEFDEARPDPDVATLLPYQVDHRISAESIGFSRTALRILHAFRLPVLLVHILARMNLSPRFQQVADLALVEFFCGSKAITLNFH
eukprot:4084724-Alexandrium_andersonii.AAC.1